ncbi:MULTISPECIES: NUDIX hydrolase [unclassified Arthrobacter]|uniref:NUDIX hydrolase n=1 Tax=unclassified Arthrobacter TaxID=235627 RepID=UPI00159DA9AA|nr:MULTISPECIES: NUDIX hydrolase [unclassified Arthrobacter]MCQ9166145.1 NUDIX hydrolase [Arthrobacter sp. STN4]NVN00741.1 NUDIX hydrolase [Arthrobacter sp. SDTb3-6]
METKEPLAPLEDACTVVLLRDGAPGLEVLMLERPGTSRAFAGAWVFPGGKVDPEDRKGPDGRPLTDAQAARAAGVREVAEETGQRLEPGRLVPLSQWTPMRRLPRRFRTWFLVARAPTSRVDLNPGEHEAFAWLGPAEALARHARREMSLVTPTWVTLHRLTAFATVAQALADAAAGVPFSYQSHLLADDGGPASAGKPATVVWAGDEAYPEASGAGPAGARHRLDMTALPWVFEQSGAPVLPGTAAE